MSRSCLPFLLLLLACALLAARPHAAFADDESAPDAQVERLDIAEVHEAIRSARVALESDPAGLHDALVDAVEAESADGQALLRAALAAIASEDEDVLSRIVARATEVGEGAAAELALGYAAVGRSEILLAQRRGGSGIALAFEDAQTIATRILEREPTPVLGALAVYLLARARYATGDLGGAVGALEHPGAEAWADLRAVRAMWRYERGSTRPAGPDGRPDESAQADLEAALAEPALLPERLAAMPRLGVLQMHPALGRHLDLTRAWAAHRLGRSDEAVSAYEYALSLGAPQAPLAVRGLASLLTYQPERLAEVLGRSDGPPALEGLIELHVGRRAFAEALRAAQRRRALDESGDARGHRLEADVLMRMDQPAAAAKVLIDGVRLAPEDDGTAAQTEVAARALMQTDFGAGLAAYEALLALRPTDPYARNNLGFLLREAVNPHTTLAQGGLQTLKPDAPPEARAWLERCVSVYAEAVALIPEEEDGTREFQTDWDLAGIVNDYALILHYFTDVQDGALAERLYHRALAMTEDGFKDTYVPNLQRLYAFVLPHRELVWYEVAERCSDAILMETRAEDGSLSLEPDERKQAAARQDARRLKARILQQLGVEAPEPVESGAESAPGNDG